MTSVESAAELGYDVAADSGPRHGAAAQRRRHPALRPPLRPRHAGGEATRTSSPRTATSPASPTRGAASRSPSTASRWRPCRRDRRDLSIWRATEPTRSVASFATSLTQPPTTPTATSGSPAPTPGRRPHLRPRLRLEATRSPRPKPISTPWLGNRRVNGARRRRGRRPRAHRDDRPLRQATPSSASAGSSVRTNGEPQALAPPLRQAQSLTAHPGRHLAGPGQLRRPRPGGRERRRCAPGSPRSVRASTGPTPGDRSPQRGPGRREHHDRRRTPRHPHRHERPPRAGAGRVQLAADRAGQRRARPRRLTPASGPAGPVGVAAGSSGFRAASTSPRCDTPSSPDPADGLSVSTCDAVAGLVAGRGAIGPTDPRRRGDGGSVVGRVLSRLRGSDLVDLVLPRECGGCLRPGADWCARCHRALLRLAFEAPAGTCRGRVRRVRRWRGPRRSSTAAGPGSCRTRRRPVCRRCTPGGSTPTRSGLPCRRGRTSAGATSKPSWRPCSPRPWTARSGARAGPTEWCVVVPAPSSRRAVRERGDTPMADLCRAAVAELTDRGGPVLRVAPALRHVRRVEDQSGLGTVERRGNLAGALVGDSVVAQRDRRTPNACWSMTS